MRTLRAVLRGKQSEISGLGVKLRTEGRKKSVADGPNATICLVQKAAPTQLALYHGTELASERQICYAPGKYRENRGLHEPQRPVGELHLCSVYTGTQGEHKVNRAAFNSSISSQAAPRDGRQRWNDILSLPKWHVQVRFITWAPRRFALRQAVLGTVVGSCLRYLTIRASSGRVECAYATLGR